MGAKSNRKGKTGEREIVNILKEHGFHAERSAQYCGKSPDSADVITDIPGLHIEVKRTETLSLYTAMGQAERDASYAREPKVPVVFHRRSGKDWLAILSLEDFLHFFKIRKACQEIIKQHDLRKTNDPSGNSGS